MKYKIYASVLLASITLFSCGGSNSKDGTETGAENLEDSQISLQISEPQLDEKSKLYSFTATLEGIKVDAENVKYELSIRGFEGVEKESGDGKFAGIEGLKDNLIYVVSAKIKVGNADTILIHEVNCPYIENIEPITKAEMQKLFEALGDDYASPLLGNNDKIAPDMSLVFNNIKGEEKKPESIAAVQEKLLFGDWSGLTVQDLQYDSYNRVSQITLQIKY